MVSNFEIDGNGNYKKKGFLYCWQHRMLNETLDLRLR